MKLTVRDVARVFDAPERTIERWMRDDGLPHHRVQGQAWFHRAEIIEWANEHGIRIANDAAVSTDQGAHPAMLSEALAAGGIHREVEASDRESVLRAVIDRMPLDEDVDREMLVDVLLAREHAGSTGVGDGIAIPHVRNPVVLPVDHPVVTLCFLANPVDFKAIDGKPVHTVFAIATPTIRVHLVLLARLAGVLHDADFRRALIERAPADRILALARDAEQRFTGGARGDAKSAGGAETRPPES